MTKEERSAYDKKRRSSVEYKQWASLRARIKRRSNPEWRKRQNLSSQKSQQKRKRDSEEHKKQNYRWMHNNPEKVKCHSAVARAIRSGLLKRPDTCFQCKKEAKCSAHHEDYQKPLEVIWLCESCHRILHSPIDIQ